MAMGLLLRNEMRPVVFLCVVLAATSSCGRRVFPDYDSEPVIRQEEEQGNYRAEFTAINVKWAGRPTGYSIFWARANQFYARVSMKRLSKKSTHLQYIHAGPRCPDKTADVNLDGVIDRDEVVRFSGKAILALDGNLTSLREGSNSFPESDEEGSYLYYEAASFRYLMADFRKRLGQSDLRLHERTLVIYGHQDSPHLPVACAEIFEDYQPEE